MKNSSILIFILLFLIGCKKSSQLKLVLDRKTHTKLDTLSNFGYDKNKCFLLLAFDSYGFGEGDSYYVVSKKNSEGKEVAYKMLNANRFSKEYFAEVNTNDNINCGWFYLKNGVKTSKWPIYDKLLDSIRLNLAGGIKVENNRDKFIYEKDGKTVKILDYGNLVTKWGSLDFDNLNYGFYKLQGDSLFRLSGNGDDLFKESNGIFFISRPGYGIKYKYSNKAIIDAVDSVSKLKSPPKTLKFDPVQ